MLINEPMNLREWELRAATHAPARLYTAGRPGRGTPGYGRVRRPVENAIIDAWVAGLPAADVLHIVSLLGRKQMASRSTPIIPFGRPSRPDRSPVFRTGYTNGTALAFLCMSFELQTRGVSRMILWNA